MGFEETIRDFIEEEKKKVKDKERALAKARSDLIVSRRELKTKERGYLMLIGKTKKQVMAKEELKQEPPKTVVPKK